MLTEQEHVKGQAQEGEEQVQELREIPMQDEERHVKWHDRKTKQRHVEGEDRLKRALGSSNRCRFTSIM